MRMKVKCIKNDSHYYDLTIGKTYEVIRVIDYLYYVINDKGRHGSYPKQYFKTLAENRNEKIDKLLR